jgi:hypothetical protein
MWSVEPERRVVSVKWHVGCGRGLIRAKNMNVRVHEKMGISLWSGNPTGLLHFKSSDTENAVRCIRGSHDDHPFAGMYVRMQGFQAPDSIAG